MSNWAQLFGPDHKAKHHAFVVAGEPSALLPRVKTFLQQGLAINSAEIYEWQATQFGINDSRVLKEHLTSPAGESERFILVGFEKILPEAEQALLKILEEPPQGLILILVCPRPLILPTTILSRVWLVGGDEALLGSKLLDGSPAERLALLTKEIARTEAGDESIESLAWPALAKAEQELASRLTANSSAETLALGEDLGLIRRLLTHKLPARSPKNLLEYLTLIWPRL